MKDELTEAISGAAILLSGLVRFDGVMIEEYTGESKQSHTRADQKTPVVVAFSPC
ncbi:MAG: hypothetical protein QNK27_07510 [Desulfuromusa sp.]|nr:hypothetical protein [Desulfuromusa sp.]